ncbi:MerR family transcriptional regulator [Staphylococcus equorum]|uniref:MerR family transcriptional regulator n=1 Tax=Staphylococcus equorum TaxID=246432 RepID=A0A9X4R0A2_9STAP|nr:MerR family transcriptional regulator [Staphylococcus equorum]MDG0842088.1 MerR family transcriptional regulator [Staphylococcus equorum]MDG0857861.1 MerR family transcriptional regulator [Staphylococcus equorum]
MYSIGQVSEKFQLPVSTLRYYDKEGLLPNLMRGESGVRQFDDQALEAIRVIECLKKSGTSIKDIKQFMMWCEQGPSTYNKRLNLFEEQKVHIENEIKELENTLNMIEFKRWYYKEALKNGDENFAESIPEILPSDVEEHYVKAHN